MICTLSVRVSFTLVHVSHVRLWHRCTVMLELRHGSRSKLSYPCFDGVLSLVMPHPVVLTCTLYSVLCWNDSRSRLCGSLSCHVCDHSQITEVVQTHLDGRSGFPAPQIKEEIEGRCLQELHWYGLSKFHGLCAAGCSSASVEARQRSLLQFSVTTDDACAGSNEPNMPHGGCLCFEATSC